MEPAESDAHERQEAQGAHDASGIHHVSEGGVFFLGGGGRDIKWCVCVCVCCVF